MLTGLDGDLKALAAELGAAQAAVKGEVATLTDELIAAKLLIAEKEEIIERLRREARAPKIEEDATADELRALLASERAQHQRQLDDAHARLAEVVPLPMSSPDSTRDLSTPRFSPERQKGKMFSRAVTKASTLKQRPGTPIKHGGKYHSGSSPSTNCSRTRLSSLPCPWTSARTWRISASPPNLEKVK